LPNVRAFRKSPLLSEIYVKFVCHYDADPPSFTMEFTASNHVTGVMFSNC